MTTFVPLPLLKSIAQCGASKHDQWRGYMTTLVVNHGILKSISILTMVIRLMRKSVGDKLWDCFHQDV